VNELVEHSRDDRSETFGPSIHAKLDSGPLTILVLAPANTIPDHFLSAMTLAFPMATVEHVSTVRAACEPCTHPVGLILLAPMHLAMAETLSLSLLSAHPDAFTAVVEHDSISPTLTLSALARSKLVKGILPMDLRLDLWLSVVSLMLHGGAYFPSVLLEVHVPNGVNASNPTSKDAGKIMTLTRREVEIAAFVCRGLQNKNIASELGLSENTVKIHIHNIIGKLGVHNRTEAAAQFRDHWEGAHAVERPS
jgi:DNA-binding NarL/FixJ family response regulator